MGVKFLRSISFNSSSIGLGSSFVVKNFNVAVKEEADDIIFLYKVNAGGTNRSYGIQVARLAELPHEVIDRAKKILEKIESENLVGINNKRSLAKSRNSEESAQANELMPAASSNILTNTSEKQNKLQQLKFFTTNEEPSPILDELKDIDLKNLTPIQALNKLYELQKKVNGRGDKEQLHVDEG